VCYIHNCESCVAAKVRTLVHELSNASHASRVFMKIHNNFCMWTEIELGRSANRHSFLRTLASYSCVLQVHSGLHAASVFLFYPGSCKRRESFSCGETM
jgi:hypothetical protein